MKPALTSAAGPPAPPLAYRVPDAAAALGLSERQVWRLIATGELRHFKVGRITLLRATDIHGWLELKASAAP